MSEACERCDQLEFLIGQQEEKIDALRSVGERIIDNTGRTFMLAIHHWLDNGGDLHPELACRLRGVLNSPSILGHLNGPAEGRLVMLVTQLESICDKVEG